jgi:iron(III) transport system ATP-binding protein
MSDLAIDATGVTKTFGANRAVERADLQVRRGELVALLGPSGSGKTTLLRLIAGFEMPDSGTVHIGGRAVAGDGVWEEPDRRRIGMVFQEGALFPHLTVGENLAFGRPRPGRAQECLALVGLADRAGSYPHELSGGERQRVALARALAVDPEVVLLDEPFAALDEGLRVGLREEVAAVLRTAGASALLVTHNQEEALSLADVVAVMRGGRIEQVGAPRQIYDRPVSRWVAEFLGDADAVPGSVSGDGPDRIVTTELGPFPASGVHGAAEVLLRPEQVQIVQNSAQADDAGPVATVVAHSYFGHDQIVWLELASGVRLRSRMLGRASWQEGDTVRVRLSGAPIVLPA